MTLRVQYMSTVLRILIRGKTLILMWGWRLFYFFVAKPLRLEKTPVLLRGKAGECFILYILQSFLAINLQKITLREPYRRVHFSHTMEGAKSWSSCSLCAVDDFWQDLHNRMRNNIRHFHSKFLDDVLHFQTCYNRTMILRDYNFIFIVVVSITFINHILLTWVITLSVVP